MPYLCKWSAKHFQIFPVPKDSRKLFGFFASGSRDDICLGCGMLHIAMLVCRPSLSSPLKAAGLQHEFCDV